MKNFKDVLQEFIIDRACTTSDSILISNLDYRKLSEECINLHSLIEKHLPKDYKYLIGTYEETESMIYKIIIESIYEQGLKDGIALTNYILNVS
ncbi:hypothetical protein R9X47_03565 [Wukongibacter baidiensis]|uniref:hypothetical protein n=1 Tax=Wukongibacter baidiensis TaxID=1723361 RepID=UPI003D7FB9A8